MSAYFGSDAMRSIEIAPLGRGWSVGEARLANAQFFFSAAHAERAAISLGQRLTDVGQPSEVRLRLANGQSGGCFICAGTIIAETRT